MRCSSLGRLATIAGLLLCTTGCFDWAPSKGGGQTKLTKRVVDPADVVLPPGYRIEAVAQGLTYPSAVAFDDRGTAYVVEAGYSYGEDWTAPKLLRIEANGQTTEVARGAENGPWTGVAFHDGNFYVAEGGHKDGGKILRISPQGQITSLADGLPSFGDHHTNGPVIRDGFIYFGQGTATNSGVVGQDNRKMGWLDRKPDFHDIPARDVKLAGVNYGDTGAYVPYGTRTRAGQVIRGQAKFGGGVMRIPLAGSQQPEMVAWGMRNPYGLAFAPDGTLYVTENSYDVRGSRPVWGTGDLLWKVQPGMWYGWPDFHGRMRLDFEDHFKSPDHAKPQPVLAEHPNEPPEPAARLGVHASANGMDFARDAAFGHVGQAFIAHFGDMAPQVGKVMSPVGYKVVRVDVNSGVVHDFAANRGPEHAPASKLNTGGLERPIDVQFTPDGRAMYVVDFGVMTMGKQGPQPVRGTGVLWRVTREGQR